MTRQQRKGEAFKALHAGAPFVIPNPWDAGSARVLEALGFQALATTSSGFAFTLGRPDGDTTLDEVMEHTRALDGATELPVSVDLEDGHAPEPAAVADTIARVAAAGAVGGSIEDWDRAAHRLYDFGHAVERITAAVEAARALDFPFTLTARAENHVHDRPDLDDTIRRLQAFEAAGADVLFAPGLTTLEDIRTVCGALSRPVNVLSPRGISLAQLADAGAQRVSVGSGLARVAFQAMAEAATRIRDHGEFSALSTPPSLSAWLRA